MDDVVRRVGAGEWRAYRELRLEALLEAPLAFEEQYATSAAAPDEFWQERVADCAAGDEQCMFVAARGGKFVAKASCFVEDDGVAQVVGVYVTPEARGAGLGAQVVSAAVRWAQPRPIHLFVLGTNEVARSLYQKLGFAGGGVNIRAEEEMVYSAT